PVPTVKTKDHIGLLNGKPALDVVDRFAVHLAALNVFAVELPLEGTNLLSTKSVHFTLTARLVWPVTSEAPSIVSPCLSAERSSVRSSRGAWAIKKRLGIVVWSEISKRGWLCLKDNEKSGA